MIAAINSKFTHSIGQGVASAFHTLSLIPAPGLFNGGNPDLAFVTMLLILILTGVCTVGNSTQVTDLGKINSTATLS